MKEATTSITQIILNPSGRCDLCKKTPERRHKGSKQVLHQSVRVYIKANRKLGRVVCLACAAKLNKMTEAEFLKVYDTRHFLSRRNGK